MLQPAPIFSLCLLFVGEGCKGVKHNGEDAECNKVWPKFGDCRALQIYRAKYLDIVSRRQYRCKPLRPEGHRVYGGEKTAHQHKYHNEEEHHEHRLLHSLREVGNRKAEARNRKDKDPLQILALFFRIPKKNRIFTPDCLY